MCRAAELRSARLPPAANGGIFNEENRGWRCQELKKRSRTGKRPGRRGDVCPRCCLDNNTCVLHVVVKASCYSREPGPEFRCCSPAFEVDDITCICHPPPLEAHMLVTRMCAHTLAPSVNNDEESQHWHESEGRMWRVCRASAAYVRSTWQQKLNIAAAQQDHASYC